MHNDPSECCDVPKVADLVCGEVVVEAYPILNIYPARRMFHQPLEITMPVRDAKAAKERWKNCHPRSDLNHCRSL